LLAKPFDCSVSGSSLLVLAYRRPFLGLHACLNGAAIIGPGQIRHIGQLAAAVGPIHARVSMVANDAADDPVAR
jgi:hypothetical protein